MRSEFVTDIGRGRARELVSFQFESVLRKIAQLHQRISAAGSSKTTLAVEPRDGDPVIQPHGRMFVRVEALATIVAATIGAPIWRL